MKLRIFGNSIRLRLSQSEVVELAEKGRVSSTLTFSVGELAYELAVSKDVDHVASTFIDGRITVSIPERLASDWCTTDRVGIEGQQPLDDGSLHILIEKDFTCLQPRAGDEDRDTFPNPLAR